MLANFMISMHRYITSDLHVICHSLKEYNAYRNFLEFEFMKLRKQQEDEVKERERKVPLNSD